MKPERRIKIKPWHKLWLLENLARIELPDHNGCMVWRGSKGANGYAKGLGLTLARVMLAIMHVDLPQELNACHTCDNPSCLNPHHLFIGTQKQNIHDMIKKDRQPKHWFTKKEAILQRRRLSH